jgi:hypothetical protein
MPFFNKGKKLLCRKRKIKNKGLRVFGIIGGSFSSEFLCYPFLVLDLFKR